MNENVSGKLDYRAAIQQVLAEIAPDIDLATIDPARPIREQTDFDSMDVLHFAIGLKALTGCDVPERDYRELESIKRCMAYLNRRQSSCGPTKHR